MLISDMDQWRRDKRRADRPMMCAKHAAKLFPQPRITWQQHRRYMQQPRDGTIAGMAATLSQGLCGRLQLISYHSSYRSSDLAGINDRRPTTMKLGLNKPRARAAAAATAASPAADEKFQASRLRA